MVLQIPSDATPAGPSRPGRLGPPRVWVGTSVRSKGRGRDPGGVSNGTYRTEGTLEASLPGWEIGVGGTGERWRVIVTGKGSCKKSRNRRGYKILTAVTRDPFSDNGVVYTKDSSDDRSRNTTLSRDVTRPGR